MAKQEITLKGLDGHEDHLVYDAADGQMSGSLEDCPPVPRLDVEKAQAVIRYCPFYIYYACQVFNRDTL